MSSSHEHVQGTPQGSTLSPFLFNILMEGLFSVLFDRDVHLLCHADDLALIIHRRNGFQHAPITLAQLQLRCAELGLKINLAKSKYISFGLPPPQRSLLLGEEDIDYAATHQYLGVWLNPKNNFGKQVKYLREHAAARARVLRAISHRGFRASTAIKRTYYVAAIRSIVDYCTPCLVGLALCRVSSLEVIQNDAMRAILRAPRWTRIHTLQQECGLPSLHHHILARTSVAAA